ncbi:sigma-54 dependent transcriptional regulator [Candidatus Binatia bacterium]|nr:sigma-54 dependent transcriptional regulator [Candidatus Binatia bacterium]
MSAKILLVEDEANMVRTLSRILERAGYEVATAANGKEALEILDREVVDVLITDLNMPVMDGMALLRSMQELVSRPATVVLTGYGTIQSAVDAMKLGASDYLIKPCNPDDLKIVIDRQLELRSLRREVANLKREVQRYQRYGELIGDDPAMQRIYQIIATVSQNKSTVLITGASGTGKELVARTLHAKSPWSRAPFVAVNCGAFTESLLDSQLFGHRRGAFTGAINDQEGVFQAATGGTLFLDEISEIPLGLQGKFLRAIQEREITPLGTTRPVKVDVRLVAASNKDLREQIRRGEFREDLFYRLNVVNIHLPRLAERRGDIPALIDHFITEFSRQYAVAPKHLSPAARDRLIGHDWPGNIRELQNTIERAFAMTTADTIELEDIAPGLPAAPDTRSASPPATDVSSPDASALSPIDEALATDVGMAAESVPPATYDLATVITLEEAERRAISAALRQARGNKNEAARLLHIDRQRLYRKMEKYRLS